MKPKRKPKPTKEDRLLAAVEKFLEDPVWIPGLKAKTSYVRLHDDHDGTRQGRVCVAFSEDGDAWLETETNHRGGPLRFRSHFGGGESPRTRIALMILARAIQLDSEAKPQK